MAPPGRGPSSMASSDCATETLSHLPGLLLPALIPYDKSNEWRDYSFGGTKHQHCTQQQCRCKGILPWLWLLGAAPFARRKIPLLAPESARLKHATAPPILFLWLNLLP